MKKLLVIILSLLALEVSAQGINSFEWGIDGQTSKGLEKARSVRRSYDTREEALAFADGRFYAPLAKWEYLGRTANVEGSVYRTTVNISKEWVGRDIFINIGRGNRSYYLRVNETIVGYAENGCDMAQFKVDRVIRLDRDNEIFLLILDKTTSAPLDAAEPFSFNRDTFVFSQPYLHIEDFHITASPEGNLETEIIIRNNYNVAMEANIGYDVINGAGDIVTYNNRDMVIAGNSTDTLRMTRVMRDLKRWSPEEPNLYTVTFRVKYEGRMAEYISFRVGFRSFEASAGGFLLNDKRRELKGASFEKPDSLTKDRLVRLKAKGTDIVNCASQPMSERFYSICDSLGVMVAENIPIKPADNGDRRTAIANNPNYTDVYIERAERRYGELQNRPSIVVWILDNGTTNGYNLYRTYLRMKEIAPSALILNNGADGEWNSDILAKPREGDKRSVITFDIK